MANEDTSIVQIPRDHSDVAAVQNLAVLGDVLQGTLTPIVEAITGLLAEGKKGLFLSAGHLGQAILKGRAREQFVKEFEKAKEKGRLEPDFAERKFGFQSWVEMMSVIDDESPDPERLEALKAMFFAVNRPNITDQEQITEYQVWRITKGLNSGELHLLKTAYENRATASYGSKYTSWAMEMAKLSGFDSRGMVDLYGESLTKSFLLSPRFHSGETVDPTNARVTDLGVRLCKNIETYRIESAEQ